MGAVLASICLAFGLDEHVAELEQYGQPPIEYV